MSAKQILGLIGSILVMVGCFLPIANVPLYGGINYMFPPGGGVGDGVFVAGLAVLGLVGAVRGGSLSLLLASVLGALVFGYSVSNFLGVLSTTQESGGLARAVMSTAGLGAGAAAIAVGLVLMFVASAIPRPTVPADSSQQIKCPSCAEFIQAEAKKCRFCGENVLVPHKDAETT